MKRFACLLLALVLLWSAVPVQASAASNTLTIPVEATKHYAAAFRMLDLINAERTSRGLNALTMDPELLELSMYRAFENAIFWSHTRPNGTHYSTLSSRLNRENIAAKSGAVYLESDDQKIMNDLMDSTAHRENILLPDAKSIGIGVITIGFNAYWVENFSRSAPIGKATPKDDVKGKEYVEVPKDLDHYKASFAVDKSDLEAGESTELHAIWSGKPMPFESVTVYSSNPNVASVSGSTVTAHGSGSTVLTLYYGDFQAAAQELTITVTGGEPAAPYHHKAFRDVKAGDWYADAVQWAVDNSITSGTTDSTFSPGNPCTRAQAVTFLWRSSGAPEHKIDDYLFYDVSPTGYYCMAVYWAVEGGITKGVSEGRFAPSDLCTRAQIVTFLWRLAGAPKINGTNPFSDVKPSAYYYDAVLWAVEQGITAGVSKTSFAPNLNCTRAQIVTFLYRNMTEPGL